MACDTLSLPVENFLKASVASTVHILHLLLAASAHRRSSVIRGVRVELWMINFKDDNRDVLQVVSSSPDNYVGVNGLFSGLITA